MTIDDLDAVLAIQEPGSIQTLTMIFPQDTHPFPHAQVRERWRGEIADPGIGTFVSVGDDGAVNGYAATRGDELLHFGTAIACWGTGLAQRLHDATLAEIACAMPAAGGARLRVFEANGRARRFYEKLGWRPTGQTSRSTFAPFPVLLEYARPLTSAERVEC